VSTSGKLCSSPNLLKETQRRPVRLAKEVEVVKNLVILVTPMP